MGKLSLLEGNGNRNPRVSQLDWDGSGLESEAWLRCSPPPLKEGFFSLLLGRPHDLCLGAGNLSHLNGPLPCFPTSLPSLGSSYGYPYFTDKNTEPQEG